MDLSKKRLPVEFNRIYNQRTPGQEEASFVTAAMAFERYGEASDWKSVVAQRSFALLLKKDGTLWTWTTNGPFLHWPGLAKLPLKQLGSASDWAEIRKVSSQYIYLRKKDGSVWSNVSNAASGGDSILSIDHWTRSAFLDGHDWLGLAVVEYPSQDHTLQGRQAAVFFNRCLVGIRDDGRFRLVAGLPGGSGDIFIKRDVPLNSETNWVGLEAFDTGEAVLLKSDGSLCGVGILPACMEMDDSDPGVGSPRGHAIGLEGDRLGSGRPCGPQRGRKHLGLAQESGVADLRKRTLFSVFDSGIAATAIRSQYFRNAARSAPAPGAV